MSLIKKILAFAVPTFFLGGCVQYKDELARQYYEHMEAKGKPVQAEKEEPKAPEPKLEDRAKNELKQEDLDTVDADSVGFVRVRNQPGIKLSDGIGFNMLANGGIDGTWQDSLLQNRTSTAQLKGILKIGDIRFATIFQDMYQVDKADPEDQEGIDLNANLSRLIGSLGAHFATSDKDFMVYVEPVKLGVEYTDIGGPLDLWARDVLLGANAGCASKSLDFLANASVMASTSVLFGKNGSDKYKGTIGDAEIPVDGKYERIFGSVNVLQGLGAKLYVFAKAGVDITRAKDCLETSTYVVSAGLQKRITICQLPFAVSASLYGRDHYKQFEGQDRATRELEYGAMLKAQLDLLKGLYIESYLKFAPQYDHGAFRGHFFKDANLEAGLAVTGILGDMFGSGEKKK